MYTVEFAWYFVFNPAASRVWIICRAAAPSFSFLLFSPSSLRTRYQRQLGGINFLLSYAHLLFLSFTHFFHLSLSPTLSAHFAAWSIDYGKNTVSQATADFQHMQCKLASYQNLSTKVVWQMLKLNLKLRFYCFCRSSLFLCPTDLCWKKVSRALQTVYLSWMVSRCSSCWLKVRPWTLMLGGRISATHCRELRAGDLWSGRLALF